MSLVLIVTSPIWRTPYECVSVKWIELYHCLCSFRAPFSASLPHGKCHVKHRTVTLADGVWPRCWRVTELNEKAKEATSRGGVKRSTFRSWQVTDASGKGNPYVFKLNIQLLMDSWEGVKILVSQIFVTWKPWWWEIENDIFPLSFCIGQVHLF